MRRRISTIAYMTVLVMVVVVVMDIQDGSLSVENCLKDYLMTVCCVDELPVYVGIRSRAFIVNTDTCERGGVSLSPRETRIIFRFAGKRTGNVSPPFRQRSHRQRIQILLLFNSNPIRRHRHLLTALTVLLQAKAVTVIRVTVGG